MAHKGRTTWVSSEAPRPARSCLAHINSGYPPMRRFSSISSNVAHWFCWFLTLRSYQDATWSRNSHDGYWWGRVLYPARVINPGWTKLACLTRTLAWTMSSPFLLRPQERRRSVADRQRGSNGIATSCDCMRSSAHSVSISATSIYYGPYLLNINIIIIQWTSITHLILL